MRPKSLILLALALGCGLIASIGISQVMDRNANRSASIPTQPIYVALHNINVGDPIDADMVALQEWPKDKVPPGSLSQLEDVEGRRPRSTIIEGEPLLEAKLLAPGEMADPIGNITSGMRLVTVSVDAEKSAAGLLSPGDRVDIQLFVRRDPRNGIQEPKTKVILENIRVFAVDQAVQRSADGGEARTIAKTISLMLTPEQVGKVNLAEKVGEISLIPRNPDDEESSSYGEISLADLLDESDTGSREDEQGREEEEEDDDGLSGGGLLTAIRNAIPKPDAKPPFRMEIVLADEVTEMLFDAETGRPIRALVPEPTQALRPGGITAPGSAPTPAYNSSPASDFPIEEQMLDEMSMDDFPIDFE